MIIWAVKSWKVEGCPKNIKLTKEESKADKCLRGIFKEKNVMFKTVIITEYSTCKIVAKKNVP